MSQIITCCDATGLIKYFKDEHNPRRNVSSDESVELQWNNVVPLIGASGDIYNLLKLFTNMNKENNQTISKIQHVSPGIYVLYTGPQKWMALTSRTRGHVMYPYAIISLKLEYYNQRLMIYDEHGIFEHVPGMYSIARLTAQFPKIISFSKERANIIKNGNFMKVIPHKNNMGMFVRAFNQMVNSSPETPLTLKMGISCVKCGIAQHGTAGIDGTRMNIVCVHCAGNITAKVFLPDVSQLNAYKRMFPEHEESIDKLFNPKSYDKLSFRSECRNFTRVGDIMLYYGRNMHEFSIIMNPDIIINELKKCKLIITLLGVA